MNLALGTLYGWSVFVAPLEKQFGWKRADTSMVFTIAVVMLALGSSGSRRGAFDLMRYWIRPIWVCAADRASFYCCAVSGRACNTTVSVPIPNTLVDGIVKQIGAR